MESSIRKNFQVWRQTPKVEIYSEYTEKRKIEENADKADRQMDLIAELNRNIFDFLLKPFEENIIKEEGS